MAKKYCEIAADMCCRLQETPVAGKIFSAYSSHDPDIVDQIQKALKQLNKETGFNWVAWEKDLDIENNLIFCEICKNIFFSKAILVELSELNFNVIFEYGHALGLSKRIYPTVNQKFNYETVDRFLYPLLGIGISKYENNKLAQKLIKKNFWEKKPQETPYSFNTADILSDQLSADVNRLLYIKNVDSPDITEAIEQEILKARLDFIVDDGQEESNNIVWYSKQIKQSFAAIIDIGISDQTSNLKHFLKCALIAGLCISTGRRLLIMNSVHAPKPTDIISIIKHYQGKKDAGNLTHKFLKALSNDFSVINSLRTTAYSNKELTFDSINLGDHVAENDGSYLHTCFIETPEYRLLSKNGYKLIVGRKGTGKSAAFFHFKKTTIKNPKDLVIHQHFDKYNLNDIYALSEQFQEEDSKHRIVSAFWKFIILHIIAEAIKEDISTAERHSSEQVLLDEKFLKFYSSQKVFSEEKSITEKLFTIIKTIKDQGTTSIKKIQEQFYSSQILSLLKEIINYFRESDKMLFLNIDGLDANLSLNTNRKLISPILYNLHETCSTLFTNKFEKFSINLFIRSDLYNTFEEQIPEKDKINKILFSWSEEQLIQLINVRLQANLIDHFSKLLDNDLDVNTLLQKLNKFVYCRPRDYIFFFNSMIHNAQSQRREKINLKVFDAAMDSYAIHINDAIEGEFISMPFDFRFGQFMNNLKHVNNSKDRIPISTLQSILSENLGLDTKLQRMLMEFMLRIEFLYIRENNAPVKWNNIISPDAKLSLLLKESEKRRIYFHFHPIIQKLLRDYY